MKWTKKSIYSFISNQKMKILKTHKTFFHWQQNLFFKFFYVYVEVIKRAFFIYFSSYHFLFVLGI